MSNSKEIDEEELKKLKILYIHGFDGQTNKVQQFTKLFPNTKCPDMSIKETVARGRLYVTAGSALGIGLISYISYILGIKKNRLYSMLAFIMSSGTVLAFFIRWGMRKVLRNTLNNSLEVQRRYIKNFKPDVVVASTFGGAVIAEIIRAQKHFYKNPLLLLSPAQDELARRLGDSTKGVTIPKTIQKTIVVHGKKDHIIPHQDSIDYVNRSKAENPNIELRLEDEDHRMLKTFTEDNLKKLIRELVQ
jgi:predicted alpha/beta hydrolase family esterase